MNRTMRLVMARIIRDGLSDIGPFGKAFAPPFIILFEGMELRQVMRDRPHCGFSFRRRVEGFELFGPTNGFKTLPV